MTVRSCRILCLPDRSQKEEFGGFLGAVLITDLVSHLPWGGVAGGAGEDSVWEGWREAGARELWAGPGADFHAAQKHGLTEIAVSRWAAVAALGHLLALGVRGSCACAPITEVSLLTRG